MQLARARAEVATEYIYKGVGKILTGMVVLLRANGIPAFKHHMVRARNTSDTNACLCTMRKTARSSDIHTESVCSLVCAVSPLDVCLYALSRSNSAKMELIRMLFCVAIKADARDNSAQIAFIFKLFSALIPFCVHAYCTWSILKLIIENVMRNIVLFSHRF